MKKRKLAALASLAFVFSIAVGSAPAEDSTPLSAEAPAVAECGSPDVNTLAVVECANADAEAVPSLDPGDAAVEPHAAAAIGATSTTSAVEAASEPAGVELPANCRLAVQAVFYTSSDWLRLGQKLAADPSPCAEYYISIPPLAADKTALRCAQDDLIRGLGRQFHPVAEFHFQGWSAWIAAHPGRTWTDAGIEFRRRMNLCGYDVGQGETWSLNEMHSGVRRNIGNARPNMVALLQALHWGTPFDLPAKGIVFVIGFGQNAGNTSVYKEQLREWFLDASFWEPLDQYVAMFAQEAFPDARFWGVADASREQRTHNLSLYLEHPLLLVESGPDGAAAARDFLESTYVPLGGAAWRWTGGFGYTDVSDDQMKRFVSEQTYAVRHFAGTRPHAAPGARFAMAWAPNNTCANPMPPPATIPCMPPARFAELTGGILERLASALHRAYEQGGSAPPGACGPPGEHDWCSADIPGAVFNDLWVTFPSWID